MAYSYVTYVGDGSTVNFAVPFPYIKKADVDVLVDGSSVSFTWLTASTVQCATAPPLDSTVVVLRETEREEREVDYTSGSILDETTLDKDSNQLFFVAQEAFDALINTIALDSADNTYDANSKRIKNVADPVNDNDAVNKNWAETAGTSVLAQCITAKNAAETAETNAETAETNAETAETNAVAAKNAAETAETNAETAEANALTYKNAAEAAKTAAETAETNAETAQAAAEAAQAAAEACIPTISDSSPSGGSDGDLWYEY